ncbi:MAG: helix-hairpin-helix domain-containing protein [Hyphomicrobiaceae bacterium]
MTRAEKQNAELAGELREMADLLAAQQANGFRIMAYRRAAETLDDLERAVGDVIAESGLDALVSLPGIGRGIAASLAEMIETGRWSALERLMGRLEPEQLFQTVPGIGPGLAHDIHETLHIDTLEALEVAANDGRLATVSGIGPRRLSAIKALLAQRLDSRRLRAKADGTPPAIADLLSVDSEYRHKAGQGHLRTIAPRRFNPEGRAWLPVLHAERGDWSFTALYSNTRRAHELKRTQDWVVIFAHKADTHEQQCTVVTEHRGPITGERVVRGREGECIEYYSGS